MKFHYGILLAVLSLGAVVAQSNKIDAGLQKTLQRNGHAAILVTMKEGTKDILDKLNTMSFSSRVERYQAVYDALTSHARDSQEKVLRFLSTPSTSNKFRYANVTSFWITNQIGIQMASSAFVDRLVTMDGISKIEEEAIMHLVEPTELRKVSDDSPIVKDDNVWSVETVNAPKVWAKGYAGEGVRILVVDTGIRGTHEAFAKSFPNDEYSWYDATPQARSVPYDDNAHGTHVCGTAAGGYGIGVAPNSKIGACKALRADGSGTTADLLKCWQFAVCPRGNCNATYHIINNSWGNSQAYRGFDSGIETLKSFGVLSIFASGNDGPGCGSHGSPGDHPDVISVASTRSDNMVSDFSSRGPVATTRNVGPKFHPFFKYTPIIIFSIK